MNLGLNDSGTDINVLTKFQPMPKRFMVWDKGLNKFYEDSNGIVSGGGICWLTEFLNNCGRPIELLEIVQSTNLFDKDDNEIFEGSIVRGQVFDDPKTRIFGVVIYRQQAFWIMNAGETHGEPLLKFYERELEVIGHILSNPELLEKNGE